jgi:hypothetical protein
MHPTHSLVTRFDFDVVTGPVEPRPAFRPLPQPSSVPKVTPAAPTRDATKDPTKPAP